MTLLPVEQVRIGKAPEDLPKYELEDFCAVCGYGAAHAHHVVRRSYTAGPKDWILVDGEPVKNLIPLCFVHHQQVTEGKTRIIFVDGWWAWHWHETLEPAALSGGLDQTARAESTTEGDGNDEASFPSSPPPPSDTVALSPALSEGEAISAPTVERGRLVQGEFDSPSESAPKPGEDCALCKRRVPKAQDEKPKKRANWSLRVPKDVQEDGVEVIESLLENLRVEFGREKFRGVQYYVLVQALYFVVQHSHLIEREEAAA